MSQTASADEYALKAAMLYNLARYIEWPSSAYPNPQAPIVYCILGHDPFGDALTDLAKQAVHGHAIEIRHVVNDNGLRTCHLLYISSSERKSVARVFANLNGSSVLTVGDMTQFALRGGMIQFSLEEKRVRFQINAESASQVKVKISSQLLALARIVKSEGGAPKVATTAGSSAQF